MMSPINIPVNVLYTIQIPVSDANDDDLRCRWASGTSECSGVCPPGSLPTGTTISSDCKITITGTVVNNYYAVTVTVEDFYNSSSTSAMSSVPVQFLVKVVSPLSCSIGPQITGTPLEFSCTVVVLGTTYSSTLIAWNNCSGVNIIDIATLSFPGMGKSNLMQYNATYYYKNLMWTPTQAQLGFQLMCAMAVNSVGDQSSQYCFSFYVSSNPLCGCPNSGITCPTSTTTTSEVTTVLSTISLFQKPAKTYVVYDACQSDSVGDCSAATATDSVVNRARCKLEARKSLGTISVKSQNRYKQIIGSNHLENSAINPPNIDDINTTGTAEQISNLSVSVTKLPRKQSIISVGRHIVVKTDDNTGRGSAMSSSEKQQCDRRCSVVTVHRIKRMSIPKLSENFQSTSNFMDSDAIKLDVLHSPTEAENVDRRTVAKTPVHNKPTEAYRGQKRSKSLEIHNGVDNQERGNSGLAKTQNRRESNISVILVKRDKSTFSLINGPSNPSILERELKRTTSVASALPFKSELQASNPSIKNEIKILQ
ncbi:unnamed protein product [Didymodactylos carnosus]|uniref:Uncharacterized protein n=1 Tax=Didymodactylos carnosus TaxID=1234261 RepID=A0A814M1S7_9BILA|nr:unnamed protein product [Didymodactylos carnosus]CAF3840211.1 unnamed protein product [Didymodactylos carnosus]